MNLRNDKENRNHLGVQSNSDYPQSNGDSRYKVYEQPYLNQLSKNEQQMVSQYLTTAQIKSKKQLIQQRDHLLQELHHINNHLSEMIYQLYGTINSLSYHNNQNIVQLQLSPKTTNNQSKISKKPTKIQQSSIQSTPKNNKSPQKDQLKNMNSNELDSLQQKNIKLMISLQQQIQDYQFMLTGEYWDRLDQQINKQISFKKQLQQQISYLNKTVHKHTKSYDKQIISKLQKSTYDQQVQLTFLNKKLQKKQNKLKQIEKQTQQKIEKIKKLQNQEISLNNIVEMYLDEQFEGPQSERRKKDKYQKLLTKKQKLQKIINSLNNNNLKLYNKKLSDFRSLNNNILQYYELNKQIDYNILVLVKQRKQFQQKNKHLLNKSTMMSSLQNQFPFDRSQRISQSREQPHFLKGSLTSKNRLKTYSHQANQINTKPQLNNYVPITKKPPVQYQNTIQPKPQSSLRRRVYTQLQNSHYFSSIDKKYNKEHSPIQQYVTHQDQLTNKDNFKANKMIQQKKFNSIVKNTGKKERLRTNDERTNVNQKIKRKGDSIQRQVEGVDQIQQRLRKLQQFLRKDEINLSTLKRIQQKLYSTKNNKMKPSQIDTYLSQKSRDSSSKFNSKNTQRSQQKHYKELCDRLGKDKLLIEQDVDISGLIYQGMSGKT